MCVCVCVNSELHIRRQVADLILLRHRRSVDAIMSLNMARFLNEVARDIMSQAGTHPRSALFRCSLQLCFMFEAKDLDETYMLVRLQGNPYPPARQPAITLQANVLHCRLLCLSFSMSLH